MVKRQFNSRHRGNARRGIQILEMILVLPILLIAILACFQFGPVMIVQGTLTNAAEETARETAKIYQFDISDAADVDKSEAVANTILAAAHGLTTASPGVLLILENADGVACRGDAALEALHCPAATSVTDASETKATILLNVDDAPIPQVLETFCVDISGQRFQIAAVVRSDCLPIP